MHPAQQRVATSLRRGHFQHELIGKFGLPGPLLKLSGEERVFRGGDLPSESFLEASAGFSARVLPGSRGFSEGSDPVLPSLRNPWVVSACADCPGFLVRDAAGARLPASARSLRLRRPNSICCTFPRAFAWICCPQLPPHRKLSGPKGLSLCSFLLLTFPRVGNENSARSFSDFWKSLRVVDVRAFGSWMSAPICLFFENFHRPDRSFGPGYPREGPPDVRGTSVPKTYSLG